MASNFKGKICAIVVTYHPDQDLPNRLKRIDDQSDLLIIVDNHSNDEFLELVRNCSQNLSCHLIENESNLGIAKALNLGFEFVLENFSDEFTWCLTMDQDSYLAPGAISNMIQAYDACPFKENVGIIGCNYLESTTGRILHLASDSSLIWDEVKHLPTSGCLNLIEAYRKVGGFREEFFIDYVDTDFCIRILDNGYRVIISSRIDMTHSLGSYRFSRLYKLFAKNGMITNYPAIRHYYWSRNGLTLLRERIFIEPIWSLNQLYYLLFRRIGLIVFFETDKLNKLRKIFLGMIHSFYKS